ncbi:MAG: fluoride efflux transporter CrcB [Rubrivivax sp.]
MNDARPWFLCAQLAAGGRHGLPRQAAGLAMGLNTGAGAAVAVGCGAAVGALLRWRLGAWLNPLSATVPLGTLAANVIGGYLVGLVVAWLAHHPELSPAWRLFLVTGFLGGLTTFSTFSAEVMALLQQGRLAWAGAACLAHLGGSLLATWAGIASVELGRRAG